MVKQNAPMDDKLYKTDTKPFRARWIDYIYGLQDHICGQLEETDGKARFREDQWDRGEEGKGGGGRTRVIENGDVFEKGGVNTSVVYGKVTNAMRAQLKLEGDKWFACGLSLVLHPVNPYVPTVHANWRYFELYDEGGFVTDRWFGGGTDLTPYYLFAEDAAWFHSTLRLTLDPFSADLYPKYKKWCDEYFCNTHRNNEMRGIGGIFYDHIRPTDDAHAEELLRFQQANGNAFLPAYLPIVEKRQDLAYTPHEVEWQ
jgi:coproporphyrinogen III oxidase